MSHIFLTIYVFLLRFLMTSYLMNYDGPRKKTTWQKPFAQFMNKNTRISSIIFIDLETENQEDICHFTLSMNCTHLI